MSYFKLNKYKVNKNKIGKGSFSSVYKAYNEYNKIVAIKKIYLDKKNSRELFIKEFKLLRNLNHINIIQVYDIIIEENNKVYIILEYFKNGDLSKIINNKILTEVQSQNYSIQLKDGIKYLYEHNIIHRDLKPQNILVSDENILKICDFGFARYFNKDLMLGTLCGSPLYMAPEIMGNNKYNNKSDLWSLGVIIYEFLYGKLPFKGKNLIELNKNIHENNISYESSRNIPKECIILLSKLLVQDPYNRIEWEQFFNYNWLNNSLLEKEENKLLEISISNNSESINTIKSYKYSSICNDINPSLEFNFNLNSSNHSSISDDFLSINNFKSESESESESEYESESESKVNIKSSQNKIYVKSSSPINIKNTLNESYILVSPYNTKQKSLSDSIKEYLNSSLNIVKQGYDYISKSSSL